MMPDNVEPDADMEPAETAGPCPKCQEPGTRVIHDEPDDGMVTFKCDECGNDQVMPVEVYNMTKKLTKVVGKIRGDDSDGGGLLDKLRGGGGS